MVKLMKVNAIQLIRYYIMRSSATEVGKLGNRTEKVMERGW